MRIATGTGEPLRCTILGFPPSLRGCHILIITIAPLPVLIAIRVSINLESVGGESPRCFGKGLWSRRLSYTIAIEMVVGIENLEVVRILCKAISNECQSRLHGRGRAWVRHTATEPLLNSSEFAAFV